MGKPNLSEVIKNSPPPPPSDKDLAELGRGKPPGETPMSDHMATEAQLERLRGEQNVAFERIDGKMILLRSDFKASVDEIKILMAETKTSVAKEVAKANIAFLGLVVAMLTSLVIFLTRQ